MKIAILYFGFMLTLLVLIVGASIAYPMPSDPLTLQFTTYGY